MEKIFELLVDRIYKQIDIVEGWQNQLDLVKQSRMESEEKFDTWIISNDKLQQESNTLRSLRQSLFALRQAMGHERIDAFEPEKF